MLENLLKRKAHVLRVVDEAKAKRQDLERERRDAKARLWELQQEQERLTRTIFDQKAKVFLEEDRQPIEQEIERLQARQPQVEREIEELTQEISPRLERHLQEAEQAVKAEALTLRYQAAIRATEGREALLKRWNSSTADLLRVAEEIGKFNGRYDFHQKGYRCAAEEQKQPMQGTGAAIPSTILHALSTALSEAWRRGYAKGESEANANDVRLDQ